MEKKPELIADKGRVRSKEDEEALDKKIAEIRKKNQLIEQRKELVEEDRANFINEYGKISLDNEAKGTMYRNRGRNGKNAKKLRNCNNGNDDNGNVSYNMKLMSRLKQSHAFSNRQANRKSTGNYKKLPSPSELPKKRHSIRRITSTASVTLLTTTVTQQLDTVKVNVSMLELKKDAQNIAKSNNNTGKVDNNRQKLAGIVAETAAISAASIQSIAEEYEVSDNDIIMMEDVRKLMEEILLQMK